MILSERCFFHGGVLEVELGDDRSFRLRYGDRVEYVPGKRTLRGRSSPYRFRSVEQLRYDFERDVKAAGGEVG
jgi:hypothetical protein